MEIVDIDYALSSTQEGSLRAINAASHRQIYLPLRLGELWEISIDESGRPLKEPVGTDVTWLSSDKFYLATSIEEISLPLDMFGILSTKSEVARLGLDCLGSSIFVSPGFGQKKPTPLVMELRPQIRVPRPNSGDVLVHAMFFRMNNATSDFLNDHHLRFPLG